MNEVDDRLFGDPVWELFADPAIEKPRHGLARYRGGLIVAGVSLLVWLVSPALAVLIAAISVGVPDFRRGRELARSIPEKAGGTICARFSYAWGFWKIGLASFGLMFVTAFAAMAYRKKEDGVPPELVIPVFLWTGGFFLSSILTAMGLITAYRSEMRIWIGKGVNEARTLLLGMLIVGFTMFVLMPMLIFLGTHFAPGRPTTGNTIGILVFMFVSMFGGPVGLLVVLDRISRKIVAETPGKFGPKVPTVGKWNSASHSFETSPPME